MMKGSMGLILVVCFILVADAAREADLIKDLPGLEYPVKFKQYSGFLDATGTKKFFYWFVESENDPAKDPVVLWLNGGPGCSSLTGFLDELGPFRVDDWGQKLVPFQHRWNKIANIIFMESPAGVGFSHSADANYTTGDDEVAKDNHVALQSFFKSFPEYKDNDFYLAGESYAGIYLPTLATRLIDDNMFNLKGFLVGNPSADFEKMINSIVFYMYTHHVFGNNMFSDVVDACCVERNISNCDFYNSEDVDCQLQVTLIRGMVWGMGLNPYNILDRCSGGVPISGPTYTKRTHDKLIVPHPSPELFLGGNSYDQYRTRLRQMQQRFSRVGSVIPCMNDTAKTAYLNRPDVRKALHVPEYVHEWETCSLEVGIDYDRQYLNVKEQFLKLLNRPTTYRLMVFSGDLDMACDFISGSWFVDGLRRQLIEEHRPWFVDDEEDKTRQIAGFVKRFRDIDFVTVKGAGHFVPTDKPQQAFQLFERYLNNLPI